MTLNDLFLTPLYLIFIYGFLFFQRSRIKNEVIKSYFIPAVSLKIIGAISVGLIYQFYYSGGDTYNFYKEARYIWLAFGDNPIYGFRLIFGPIQDFSPELIPYTSNMNWFTQGDTHTYNIIRLTGFIGLFTFHTYTVIAIFFALLSFSGVWALYKAFYDMFPALHKALAYSIFFVPSVFFWGSGLLKDPITFGALGWAVHAFYFGLIKRERVVGNIIILALSALAIQYIKVYILMCFLPAASFWFFFQFKASIKSPAVRAISLPFILIVSIPLGYYGINQITADNERYQLTNIAATAQTTATWLEYVGESQGGSVYSLGEFDGTIINLLTKFPQATWLGLFRPYLWESKNPVMILSALESSFFLFLTLRILFMYGFGSVYRLASRNPVLIFCLIFAIAMAFGTALTSYNFGSLVRYRIPFMPFYLAFLYIVQYKISNNTKLY
jgi:hypothetical protein